MKSAIRINVLALKYTSITINSATYRVMYFVNTAAITAFKLNQGNAYRLFSSSRNQYNSYKLKECVYIFSFVPSSVIVLIWFYGNTNVHLIIFDSTCYGGSAINVWVMSLHISLYQIIIILQKNVIVSTRCPTRTNKLIWWI